MIIFLLNGSFFYQSDHFSIKLIIFLLNDLFSFLYGIYVTKCKKGVYKTVKKTPLSKTTFSPFNPYWYLFQNVENILEYFSQYYMKYCFKGIMLLKIIWKRLVRKSYLAKIHLNWWNVPKCFITVKEINFHADNGQPLFTYTDFVQLIMI